MSASWTPPGQDHLWGRFRHICDAAVRIAAHHNVDDVLQEIVDSSREAIGARYAALGVIDQTSGTSLSNFVTSGLSPDLREKIGPNPTGKGILGVLIADPRPLRLADLTTDPRATGFPTHHPPMRSFLGVPILGRVGPIGNLYLTDKMDADTFSDEDEAMAVMLAAHAAVAVENARLHQQQERLLGELQSLQQARDRFFAMVNHELRNAITAVYGWAELWTRRAGTEAPLAAVQVYESAERAVNLLEDLLDLSRLDASRLTLSIRDTDACEIVRQAVRSIEPAAEARQIRIDVAGAERACACETDPQRVRQVLINLLRNAVQHSPEKDVVSVELRPNGESIRFDVVDRGPGIDAAHLASIFEAYERGGRETERGTGLGLTLSRHIARLLGGDLRAESRPGRGARFILELPRVAPLRS
jgi:signal transduction histidine kinase